MGRFFSNIHIKKDNQQTSQEFIEKINESMAQRGFVSATEDDGTSTYYLAFSESNSWVTVSSDKFDSNDDAVRSDAKFFADGLKASCFSTNVVDSDFTIVEMYNATSTLSDKIIVSDGSGYGFEKSAETNGKRELWEPLLTDNATWEQLSQVWNNDSTFTESALSEMATLLGIDEKHITMDYEEFDSAEGKDPNIFMLYFKKAEKNNPNITVLHPTTQKNKPLNLNAAFKQIFGETLEPLGYKKINGKQPYFVRVVPGGEIIHVITFINEPMRYPWQKEFCILGGVATVYRQKIDLSISPKDNSGWLRSNSELYVKSNPSGFDPNFRKSIYSFSYIADNFNSMVYEVEYALEITQKIMLPIFDKATDLNACIDYFNKFNPAMDFYDEKEEFGKKYSSGSYNEGFLYIKTNNHDGIRTKMEERLSNIEENIKLGRFFTKEDYENACNTDLELYTTKVLDVLELRKAANTEILRSYRLDI